MGRTSQLVFPHQQVFHSLSDSTARSRKHGFWIELDEVPPDLENYALKPLYSFAGLWGRDRAQRRDIDAIPPESAPITSCRSA